MTGRALQQPPGQTAVDREVMTEEEQEERRRGEQTHGQTALVDSREVLSGGLQQGRKDQTPPQQQQPQGSPAAELRKELQETRPPQQLRNARDGRVSLSANHTSTLQLLKCSY